MPLKTPTDFLPEFTACFDARDLEGMLDFYADDVVAVAAPGSRLHGKAEFHAGLEGFFALKPSPLSFTSIGLVEGPETALFYGTWIVDGTSPEGPVHIEGQATVVLVQRADGWVVAIDDFFSQS